MPDPMFLDIIRYLNELYWQDGLKPEQIKALAAHVIEISCEAKPVADTKSRIPGTTIPPSDETSQILHELFPEIGYTSRRL